MGYLSNKSKRQVREQLAADTAAYIAKGGKVHTSRPRKK